MTASGYAWVEVGSDGMDEQVRNQVAETSAQQPAMSLADAIEGVRAQLMSAIVRAEGERLQFELDDIEMEFSVTLSQDTKADGGVRVWVANLGASSTVSSGATHRIKLVLHPKDLATGHHPHINDLTETLPPR